MSGFQCTERTRAPERDRAGRILLADDEETFLYATGELLRDEGYHCDCARDAAEVLKMLRRGDYDLLISDLKMPGNPHLEMINDVQRIAAALPVIVVTGYPSLDSAIDSIHLPVVAYFIKPVDFQKLSGAVAHWVRQSQVYHTMCGVHRRLAGWSEEVARLKQLLEQPAKQAYPQVVDAFIATTLKNVAESLTELQRLASVLAQHREPSEQRWMCELVRAETMVDLLRETVEVLEKTKSAFKSKQLGKLRHRLQVALDRWEENDR